MRTTLRAAAAALVLSIGAGVAQAQAPALKLAYVNTAALMEVAPGKAAAESLFAKEAGAYEAQAKRWQDSLAKLYSDYSKKEPTLTAAQKTAQQEKIQGIQTDLEAANLQARQKLQQRQNDMLAPLTELVKTAIEDIRTEGGYAIIFSNDQNSPIVSADKNLDITERVAARLKTMAAKAAPPASSMAPAAVKKPPTR